jgi:hypothetical protein
MMVTGLVGFHCAWAAPAASASVAMSAADSAADRGFMVMGVSWVGGPNGIVVPISLIGES